MSPAFTNPWKTISAMNPETEIWWDSSPLVWPNFKDDFLKGRPEAEKEWYKKELDSLFFDSPVNGWIFKGCTTNPPLSWAVLKTRKDEWAKIIAEKRKAYKGSSKYGMYLAVYSEVVKRGAEKLLPLFEASGGKLGHISGQVDPQQLRNESAMKEMAEELASLSPNVMVKIPGSTQGIPVFKYLASKGIATNATCVFNVSQIMAVARSVDEGRKIHLKESKTPRLGWRAVCTHMMGRLEDSAAFRGVIDKENLNINPLELRAASELVVKNCTRMFHERKLPIKMLVCSARLHRNGQQWFYPHVDMFMGGDLVYTIPPTVFGHILSYYRDRELKAHWCDTVSPQLIEKLNQVPYFRQSTEENGYAVEQFNEIPSLLENETEFVGATKEMIQYVGSFL
ncbi:MAG: transaldolase family protein [Spirochaetia bacterium]|jgi:transaldolase